MILVVDDKCDISLVAFAGSWHWGSIILLVLVIEWIPVNLSSRGNEVFQVFAYYLKCYFVILGGGLFIIYGIRLHNFISLTLP